MLGSVKNYIIEVRPSFLTASFIPVVLGSVIAWSVTGEFHWFYFILTLIAGLMIHASINIFNDYFDHKSGNDEINKEFAHPFSGGSRLIQMGLMTPRAVFGEALIFLIGTAAIGFYLTWARGIWVLIFGMIGAFSGYFYSAPPFKFVGRGVGEFLIGLNFGCLMILGAFYVQAQFLSVEPLVASIPIALLITAVLYINQFPDYKADKAVGKDHWVVRLGRERAVTGFIAIIALTYISILLGVATSVLPPFTLIAFLALPFSVKAVQFTRKFHSSPRELVPANATTILSHYFVGLLLVLGYILDMQGTLLFL